MSIETEKKRLTDFLVNQTAAPEASKKRAREHATTPSPRPTSRFKRSRITLLSLSAAGMSKRAHTVTDSVLE